MVQTNIDWVDLLTLVVSVLLPIVVALVTRRMAESSLKAVVLALLAAITGFLSELLDSLINNTAWEFEAAILAWITSFVIAVAVHYGLWKPTSVSGRNGVVARSTASFGVGKPSAPYLPQRSGGAAPPDRRP